jgi:CHRD domain
MKDMKLLVGALALAGLGCGISGCTPSATAAAGHPPTDSGTAISTTAPGSATTSGSVTGVSTGPGRYLLQSMPTGTVWIERAAHGHLQARVNVSGLTPGSAHQVSIEGRSGHPVWFSALTANAAGQADATLTSVDSARLPPPQSRFVIRLGDSAGDPLAAEPIAETGVLPTGPVPGAAFALHAVTFGTDGTDLGQPVGQATISYDAPAQTLTVTLTAAGLTPGPHAAHIHLGSCLNQGPVKYMMADFIADANGAIVNQTRVVTGVTSVPGPGNWYLNLHQGGMDEILANGAPTLYFRPMLCTDLTSFATTSVAGTNGTPSASPTATPTGMPTGAPTLPAPTGTPSMTMPTSTPTPVSTPTPTSSPTITINATPTHY